MRQTAIAVLVVFLASPAAWPQPPSPLAPGGNDTARVTLDVVPSDQFMPIQPSSMDVERSFVHSGVAR